MKKFDRSLRLLGLIMLFQNKKLRQQVEETEQTLYARRTRYNEQMNAALNGSPSDDSQSKYTEYFLHNIILICMFIIGDSTRQITELKLKLQESERENTANQGNVSIFVCLGFCEVLEFEKCLK